MNIKFGDKEIMTFTQAKAAVLAAAIAIVMFYDGVLYSGLIEAVKH